jgi:hypothetical protein
MKKGGIARGGMVGLLMRWAGRLRFPYLLGLTVILFVFNLFMPDAVPLIDEVIMGLIAALLASLKKPAEKTSEGGTGEHSGTGGSAGG